MVPLDTTVHISVQVDNSYIYQLNHTHVSETHDHNKSILPEDKNQFEGHKREDVVGHDWSNTIEAVYTLDIFW